MSTNSEVVLNRIKRNFASSALFILLLWSFQAFAQPDGGREGGGDGRGGKFNPLLPPKQREIPLVRPTPPRDCPETYALAIAKKCNQRIDPKYPWLLICEKERYLCSTGGENCIAEQKLEKECYSEEVTRAIGRFNKSLSDLPEMFTNLTKVSTEAKPLVDAFYASSGCTADYEAVKGLLSKKDEQLRSLQEYQQGMGANMAFAIRSGRAKELKRLASNAQFRIHLDLKGKAANIVLNAVDPLFPGATWEPFFATPDLTGVRLNWDTSQVRLGNSGLVTSRAPTTRWTEQPEFNVTKGKFHQLYLALPPGYRYCRSEFLLHAKSFVCHSALARDSRGMRVIAWIRGDADGRRWIGEFEFDANVTGIGEDATSCQAKEQGCQDIPPNSFPVQDTQCVNVTPPGAVGSCPLPGICLGDALLCRVGKYVNGYCEVDSIYGCGRCINIEN